MIRKILISVVPAVAFLAVLATTAQAHEISLTAACGSASIDFANFTPATAGPPDNGNGGKNTPSWTVSLTLPGASSPSFTTTGTASFSGAGTTVPVTIPAQDGTVTVTAFWSASDTTDGNSSAEASGDGYPITGTFKVIDCATLTTTATPASATVGSAVTDVAHLTGGYEPTGTITWKLYGPSDTSCSAANPPTVTDTVNGNGDYTSPALTPSATGIYHWVASYSGDANNEAVPPVGCTDTNETLVLTTPPPTPPTPPTTPPTPPAPPTPPTPATPAITTTAAPAMVTLGASVADVADLTGGNSPTGGIAWKLYGPNDPTCSSSTPLTTVAERVTGDGDYTSPSLTPTTVGTYHWVAIYSGDVNNTALGPVGCSDPSETVIIVPPAGSTAPATPTPTGSNGVKACVAGNSTLKKQVLPGGAFEAVVHGAKIQKVRFYLDGTLYKTLTKPDAKGSLYQIKVTPSTASFGSHKLTAKVSEQCAAQAASLSYTHPAPAKKVTPKFTG
jgi:hypothetical protein